MLRHICNKDPRHSLCFQNLKWLKVHKCGNLRNLFPASMALGLMGTIIFPKLIHLSLESLPSLTSFYQAYHVLKRFDSADDIPVAVLFNEKVSSLRILFFLLLMILNFLIILFKIKFGMKRKKI